MGPAGPDDELIRRSKISPHLLAMVMDWELRGRKETPSCAKVSAISDIPVASVLIELKTTDTSELVSAQIPFKHLFGLFYAADIPLDKIIGLAYLDGIHHVHIERSTKPTLNDSIPEIRCKSVRNESFPFGGTNKYTGLGVVVGIIDSG